MSFVIRQLFKHFPVWERPSQIGFILALVLALPALILSIVGDDAIRGTAVISLMASLLVAQAIFLWANRGMISDYTQAQRHFLRGEFMQAVTILRSHLQAHPKDVQAMTLLGNTYRQLGNLEASHAILLEAVNIQPMNYFPRYGFGRTLLVQGQFLQAIEAFEKALSAGGHAIAHYDIGEAAYFGGNLAQARIALRRGLSEAPTEHHRAWLAQVMLNLMDEETPAPPPETTRAYWATQAHLFASTPYGHALQTLLSRCDF